MPRRARWILLAGLALGTSGCGRKGPVPHNALERTRSETVFLRQAVDLYMLRTRGVCPAGQEALQAEGIVDRIRQDPWGNDYVITCPGERASVDVVSAGPDGVLGTKDDIASWDEFDTKRPTTVSSEAPMTCDFEITREAGVLEEQRRLGGRAPDFYEEVPAKVIDPTTDQASTAVGEFTVDEQPILWLAGPERQAVVDSTLFSTLTVADVTRLSPGERVVVGEARPPALRMPFDRLVEFLMRARIIATYVHMGSTVRCEGTEANVEVSRGRYAGAHTYFTNEKVVSPFAFEVELTADGTITVVALPSSP